MTKQNRTVLDLALTIFFLGMILTDVVASATGNYRLAAFVSNFILMTIMVDKLAAYRIRRRLRQADDQLKATLAEIMKRHMEVPPEKDNSPVQQAT